MNKCIIFAVSAILFSAVGVFGDPDVSDTMFPISAYYNVNMTSHTEVKFDMCEGGNVSNCDNINDDLFVILYNNGSYSYPKTTDYIQQLKRNETGHCGVQSQVQVVFPFVDKKLQENAKYMWCGEQPRNTNNGVAVVNATCGHLDVCARLTKQYIFPQMNISSYTTHSQFARHQFTQWRLNETYKVFTLYRQMEGTIVPELNGQPLPESVNNTLKAFAKSGYCAPLSQRQLLLAQTKCREFAGCECGGCGMFNWDAAVVGGAFGLVKGENNVKDFMQYGN